MDDLSTRIQASAADLPPVVAAALAATALDDPSPGRRISVEAAGIAFSALEWAAGDDGGRPDRGRPGRPLLLIHGVTSSCRIWWRVAPALAAAGWHVVAPDLPGHGLTGSWRGRSRFIETAEDVVAFARASGLTGSGATDGGTHAGGGTASGDGEVLAVVGHSWGAMVAAALPSAGLRPGRIVLLDPPALTLDERQAMISDPLERRCASLEEAHAIVAAAHPEWVPGDIAAKVETLTQFDEAAARAILFDNDWDAGLDALARPAAARVPVWVVRGEPVFGGLLPDKLMPAFAAWVGVEHVLTIVDGPHSPQRTHPEATLVALLRALGAP